MLRLLCGQAIKMAEVRCLGRLDGEQPPLNVSVRPI
jgi:hypothetical protein